MPAGMLTARVQLAGCCYGGWQRRAKIELNMHGIVFVMLAGPDTSLPTDGPSRQSTCKPIYLPTYLYTHLPTYMIT